MALPTSTVKRIMSMASDPLRVSKEAAEAMAKATELFIQDLVGEVAAQMPASRRTMKLEHLENVINTNPKYAFIGDALKTFPCEEFLCLTPSIQSATVEESESNIVDIEDMLDEQSIRPDFSTDELANDDSQVDDKPSEDSFSSDETASYDGNALSPR
ncbi:CBFD NFYB HMF domain containing protein [Trichuris trichiura]|uniref:CBFD NFYB HMF domain containing protein n=1 Tax=Trichuris trichiura TaxID=36087 RepID=A0A077ZG72_TRITR|nr:CBFD NFYB HMF domain containing protein [Trichuris trichiura]